MPLTMLPLKALICQPIRESKLEKGEVTVQLVGSGIHDVRKEAKGLEGIGRAGVLFPSDYQKLDCASFQMPSGAGIDIGRYGPFRSAGKCGV